jgi:heme/copper-type cytochrome/quinol oxidase subunit 2
LTSPDYKLGNFYNLEVDNSLVLPFNTTVRVLVTSNDVIHRFAIPALRLKIDANPGRINSINVNIAFPGIIYGNCSEMCGANHRFMPIKLESVTIKQFLDYIVEVKPYP